MRSHSTLAGATTPDDDRSARRWRGHGPATSEAYEITCAGGRIRERPLATPRTTRGTLRKGQIYVLVDADGMDDPAVAARLGSRLADAYYRAPSVSLTSALLRAIRQVNERVCAENARLSGPDRLVASIACVVVRGSEAYFAFVGRAFGCIVGDRAREWLARDRSRAGGHPNEALGQAEDVDVAMFHRALPGPATLILATPGFADLARDDLVRMLAADPNQALAALRDATGRRRGSESFRLLIISAPPSVDGPPSDEESDAEIEDDVEDADDPDPSLPLVGIARAWQAIRGRSSRRDADAGPAAEEEGPPASAAMRREWRGTRLSILPYQPGTLAMLALVGGVLFVIGYLLAAVAGRIVLGGPAYTTAATALAQADTREQEAMSQSDPAVRRRLLAEASQLADQAYADQPKNPAVATSVARIRGEYAAAINATNLGAPTRIVDLPSPADQLVLSGLDLYVLDRANNRVLRYLLNADGRAIQATANPILVQKGDHVGSVVVGQLTGMTWMPAGGPRPQPALVILDRAGYLVQYDPTRGLSYLALRDPASWTDVTALAGYAGSLYALSSARDSLIWLPPQASGYDDAAYSYFAPSTKVALADATGLVLDGDLYLTHASGQIEKFADGKPADFAPPAPELLPNGPAGVALAGNSIFLGDPRHLRIVELTRQGAYVRALGAATDASVLSSLHDLAVSDDGKALYALVGQTIFRFDVPELH